MHETDGDLWVESVYLRGKNLELRTALTVFGLFFVLFLTLLLLLLLLFYYYYCYYYYYFTIVVIIIIIVINLTWNAWNINSLCWDLHAYGWQIGPQFL